MPEKFFHFHYTVEEFGETLEGDVCIPGEDEEKTTSFIQGDVADTFPGGTVLDLTLTAVTDAHGKRC